jgi:hypothetical protein
VVTVTSTVPVPAGAIAVIEVALLTLNDAALVLPNLIDVAPAKLFPVILTLVPGGPLAGDIRVTVGPGAAVQVAVTEILSNPVLTPPDIVMVDVSVVSLLTPVTVYSCVPPKKF